MVRKVMTNRFGLRWREIFCIHEGQRRSGFCLFLFTARNSEGKEKLRIRWKAMAGRSERGGPLRGKFAKKEKRRKSF
jgi:hypothetical protein